MVPKPFPYPLGIGVDVCKVSRVMRLIQNYRLCNRWARKVFTRLEWPALWDRMKEAQLTATADTGNGHRKDSLIGIEDDPTRTQSSAPTDNFIWMLPDVSEDRCGSSDSEAVSHEHSPLKVLARHLAGRYGRLVSS